MPEHIVIGMDNTAREGKNQWFLLWLCQLVLRGYALSAMTVSGKVGHTHNGLDQRFGTLSKIIKRQERLECPEDFMETTRAHMHGLRGRTLIVRKLEATWDMQNYLVNLDVSLTGMTPTPSQANVNHCYRMVRRCDLELYKQSSVDGKPWVIAEDTVTPHPHDVILLVKQWVHSRELTQDPLFVMPHSLATSPALAMDHLKPMVRNVLSANELREYRKTATTMAKDPWNMVKAQKFLNDWCDQNESKDPILA